MKIRNSRTGEYIVVHKGLDQKRKREVFDLLGLPIQLWNNKKVRDAIWSWYCVAPLDEVFIRSGYELRLALVAVLIPPQEYTATVPSRKGDK
jgi:hypothetical protein